MVSGPSQEWAMVLYNVSDPGGNLLWRQRRILGEVAPLAGTDHSHLYAVLTADNDVYIEDFGGRVRGVTAVRFSPARRTLPGGVPSASTYRFTTDISEADLAAAQALAEEAAADWWSAQGGPQPATFLLPVGGPPTTRPPPQQGGGAAAQPQQQQTDGPNGSAPNNAPAGDTLDARTLPVKLRTDGSRCILPWRDVA